MSVKVLRHGAIEDSVDPVTRTPIRGRKVTFMQEGRATLNKLLNRSSNALNQVLGGNFGLPGRRVHTQLIPLEELEKVPVDAVIQGLHINRRLTSRPQMIQQENVTPRMVDNKLTYVQTYLDTQEREDDDQRMSNSEIIQLNPLLLLQAATRGTDVITVSNEQTVSNEVEQIQDEELVEPVAESNNPK